MERRENNGYGYLACRINRILWLDEDGVREGRDLGNKSGFEQIWFLWGVQVKKIPNTTVIIAMNLGSVC